jgi:excisionase family DNA binding protein
MAVKPFKNQDLYSSFAFHGVRKAAVAAASVSMSGATGLPAWVEEQAKPHTPKSLAPYASTTKGMSPAAVNKFASLARLLTVREVAALFQVSEKTIRRMIATGQVPFVRIGRSIRIRPEIIEKIARWNE